ncbi:DMT family protein [Lacibacterium aquatile]|uniref:DMT family protein n=1 Tax=Lacibacterium aquatile TaxID=1168082 RepID=A0ABW5DL28_9PROT
MPTALTTIGLLVASNVFMTFAWYGHLKFKETSLWKVILISWAIAFFEYCLQVPANRWGHGTFTAAQLKIIQEVITLVVFAGFSIWFLGESLKWNHLAAAMCLVGAVYFVFRG